MKNNKINVNAAQARASIMTQLNIDLGKKRNELSDARTDLKKLEKDLDKKKEIPDVLKKKADAVKTALDSFLENQKKLTAK